MSSIEDEENKGLLTLKPKTKRRNFFLVLFTFVLVLVSLSVVGAVSLRKQGTIFYQNGWIISLSTCTL